MSSEIKNPNVFKLENVEMGFAYLSVEKPNVYQNAISLCATFYLDQDVYKDVINAINVRCNEILAAAPFNTSLNKLHDNYKPIKTNDKHPNKMLIKATSKIRDKNNPDKLMQVLVTDNYKQIIDVQTLPNYNQEKGFISCRRVTACVCLSPFSKLSKGISWKLLGVMIHDSSNPYEGTTNYTVNEMFGSDDLEVLPF